MANPNVLFGRGSSLTFPGVTKDPNTLYFLTDTHEMYLGGERYAIGSEVNVVINGLGDTVADVSWDLATKTLTLTMGEAASAQSIVELINDVIGLCVKTISSDRGSAILVDSSDPENLKLSLNIAQGTHAGNVLLEECSDGLRANVDIPEAAVQSVKAGDKILSLDGTVLSSTLSISTLKENDTVYVVLKGVDGQEVSRFDASDFIKDGMLDSVSLEYSADGLNHRLLVMVFNTDAGKETIKVDLQEFINAYTAAANGGLKLEGNEFSIANEVEASGLINTDVAPAFGETIDLKTIKFDNHGLITGSGTFKFKMPELVGGYIGGPDKLVSWIGLDPDGSFHGTAYDISTVLDASSTDLQIPTAKAVWTAIENARTIWERF